MSLFQCQKCGVIDNTALSGYWQRRALIIHERCKDDLPVNLCSNCNPAIGRWHRQFKKHFCRIGLLETNRHGNLKNVLTNEDVEI